MRASEIFGYTVTRWLATGDSHRKAGKVTNRPLAHELMRNIAADENHHLIFCRGVMQAMLDQASGLVLGGIHRVFDNFQMPGVAMPNFLRRSIDVAKAGVTSSASITTGYCFPSSRTGPSRT